MQQPPLSNIKALTMLHFSLLIGQLVFGAIGYYLRYANIVSKIELGDKERYVVLGIAALALIIVVWAISLYKNKISAIKESAQAPKQKLEAYRAANIVRWAMLEVPVLIAIIAFMLRGNYNFLILAAVIWLLFLSTRPSTAKVVSEIAVSEDDVNN